MAYALLAQLSAEYGLYTSFVGFLLYWAFATSKDITIGTVAVMSQLVGNIVLRVRDDHPQYAPEDIARSLALISGAVLLFIGLTRLGWIVEFIPLVAITSFMTESGVDRQMAINHMGHVVLTSHLLPLMKSTAEKGNTVRITVQASNAHQGAPSDIKFESLEEINEDKGANANYGRSKLANILYARYFARKVTANGHPDVVMNATHPGFVSTKQTKVDILEAFPLAGYGMAVGMEPFKKDQFEGAVPTVYAATVTKESGQYLCPPIVPEAGSKLAQDDELGDRLMELTRKVVMEKTKRKSADQGCPFDDLVLH
ncbi:hypothetical protein BN1723_010175 [Verticillium longisporum]|uniref:SLC26A/SulP transporter domain-containing protein n=1 Tax=Verticillium longisporum TaxID=100787 RepID=A0A0G4KW57_VERLO|nr:hypothetical protein BN1723_010175 [Verticillium longisporum]